MPCKYLVALNGKVVLERWTGTVSIEELMAHKAQLLDDPSLAPDAAVLSDCRRAVFEISPEAISMVSEMENDADGKSRIKRYAFLVHDDLYDRVRQFANQVEKHGKTVVVFNSLDVASTWLGMNVHDVLEIIEKIENSGN